jgi:hypothetical protein
VHQHRHTPREERVETAVCRLMVAVMTVMMAIMIMMVVVVMKIRIVIKIRIMTIDLTGPLCGNQSTLLQPL